MRAVAGLVVAVMVAAWPAVAAGGVIRHDRDDALYRDLAAEAVYAPVGGVHAGSTRGSGTLISPRWVLTAAHVVDNPDLSSVSFNVGGATWTSGTSHSADLWLLHPDWTGNLRHGTDIALVRLGEPVTAIVPASRFTGEDERGMVGTIVGFGRTGDGLTGATSPAGTKRAGHNVIDAFGPALGGPRPQRYSDRIMLADFDHPDDPSYNRSWSDSPIPLDLEMMVAPGDSGGGVFLEPDPEAGPRVAGVVSFGQTLSGSVDFTYGDAMGAIRVNQFNQWIDDQIAVGWVAADDGLFQDAQRWSGDGGAPGAGDIIGFHLDGAWTVGFDQPATAHALLHRGGEVALELGGHTLALTSNMDEGAVIVGKYAGEDAALTVRDGLLSSATADIAKLAGAAGAVVLDEGGGWHLTHALHVGGGSLGPGGEGTLEVLAGGLATIDGTMKVRGGGQVRIAGGELVAAHIELAGGQLEVLDGTFRVGDDGGEGLIGLAATGQIGAPAVTLTDGATLHTTTAGLIAPEPGTDGSITLSGEATIWTAAAPIHVGGSTAGAGGDGELSVNDKALLILENDHELTVHTPGTLRGDGTVTGTAVNRGRIIPGRAMDSGHPVGTLDVEGDYLQDGEGSLLIYLGGLDADTAHNRLAVSGQAQLAGTLALQLADGYVPEYLQSHAILSHGGRTGTFSEIEGVLAGDELALAVSYTPDEIIVTSTIPGDVTLDGTVGGEDLALLLDNLGAGAPGSFATWADGDMTGDGQVTLRDASLLLNHWGREVTGGISPIPEPATAALLGLSALALLRRRAGERGR